MSTFSYYTSGRAVALASETAQDFERIVGLKGADADVFMPQYERTAAGYLREPHDTGRARHHLNKFREIKAVEWTREDADPGTITVTFTDGESIYLHGRDLLCVERPIGPTYEKCAECHLFIEPNPSAEDDSTVAAYDHLTRGDESDAAITDSHDARPSGERGSRDWWRANGPAEMIARFA